MPVRFWILGAIPLDERENPLEIGFNAWTDARIVIARCDHQLERQASRGGASGRSLGGRNAGVASADTSDVRLCQLLDVGEQQSQLAFERNIELSLIHI